MPKKPKEYSEFAISTATRQEIIDAFGEDLVMYPGHENAIIGVVERCGSEPVLCYNVDVIIQNLIGDGMPERDAYEHVDTEIIGLWSGDRTPCVINMMAFIEDSKDGT